MCFSKYDNIISIRKRKDCIIPNSVNEPVFERGCNQDGVPFLECENTCCCDCTNMYNCRYVCHDLDKNGHCKKFD